MSNLVAIFIGLALINNFILAKFLGLCSFFGVSKKIKDAVMMGVAVIVVTIVSAIISWVIYFQILIPIDLAFLHIVIFILIIAALVQIIEMVIRRTNQALYNAFGIYLPLITTNCVVLGVVLIVAYENYSLIEAIVAATAGGVGYTMVLIMMSGIRERLEFADPPACFKGMPIAFIIAMTLGLAFLAFGGMI